MENKLEDDRKAGAVEGKCVGCETGVTHVHGPLFCYSEVREDHVELYLGIVGLSHFAYHFHVHSPS